MTCQRLGSCQFVVAFEAKTKYAQIYNKLSPIPMGLIVAGGIAGAMSGIAPFPPMGVLFGIMAGGSVGLAIDSSNEGKMKKYIQECEEWERKCLKKQ